MDEPAPPSDGRDETPAERLDRNLSELLQELRVIVVGVQVMFAFLLTIAFSQREEAMSTADRGLYLAVLLVTALATACLIAPAAHHRLLFRRGRKADLVMLANTLAQVGLALVGVALSGTIALVADVLFGAGAATLAGAGTMLALALIWLGTPMLVLRRRERSR